MNAVVGLASTLLDTELDKDQRASVTAIHDAGDGLLDILNDILDFSRLEAGSLSLEVVPFSVRSVVEGALSVIRPNAEQKGLALEASVGSSVPDWVSGDPGRIRQILLNLLSNAIKFTDRGSISIILDAERLSDGVSNVRCIVRDTGMGIPEDRITDLFNDFVQVDTSISRRFGGSGLGLSICRRLLEQMGGSIDVTSKEGEGSQFYFHVPLALAKTSEDASPLARDDGRVLEEAIKKIGHRVRLLVADDSQTNRMVVTKMLQSFEIDVLEAIDGAEAVEMVASHRPDIVLMDMQMPHLDGIAATCAIRAGEDALHRISIIAFTANAFAEDREACTRAGMTDFLSKPVRKHLLVDALLRALTSKGSGSQANASLSKQQHSFQFDASRYSALAEETDPESALHLFRCFLDDAGMKLKRLTEMKSGGPALKDVAHAIKGTASTFGFMATAGIARELELTADSVDPALLRESVGFMAEAFESEKAELERTFGVAA